MELKVVRFQRGTLQVIFVATVIITVTGCAPRDTNQVCVASPFGIANGWNAHQVSGLTANDLGTGGNAATLLNVNLVASNSPSILGSVFSLQGYGSAMSVSNPNVLLQKNAFTVSAWVKGDLSSASGLSETVIGNLVSQSNFVAGQISTVDVSALLGQSVAFSRGSFDGRYVYYALTSSRAVRLDTTQTFTSSNAWTSLDLSTVVPGITSSAAGVYSDGRYVYYPTGT